MMALRASCPAVNPVIWFQEPSPPISLHELSLRDLFY